MSKQKKKPGRPKKKRPVGRPKKVIKPIKIRKASRYNIFQKELSEYLKESGHKGTYNYFALRKELWSKFDKDIPVEGIGYAIPSAYEEYDNEQHPVIDSFPFFSIHTHEETESLNGSTFGDKQVSLKFVPAPGDVEYAEETLTGTGNEVADDYRDNGLYKHLRDQYNGSPMLLVNYLGKRNGVHEFEMIASEVTGSGKKKIRGFGSDSSSTADIDKQIELEKLKGKNKDKDIELSKLQLKSKEMDDVDKLLRDKIITFDQYREMMKDIRNK